TSLRNVVKNKDEQYGNAPEAIEFRDTPFRLFCYHFRCWKVTRRARRVKVAERMSSGRKRWLTPQTKQSNSHTPYQSGKKFVTRLSFSNSAATALVCWKMSRYSGGSHVFLLRSEEHTSELQSLAYLVC